ncbi:hypothetical protein CPB86DRAFT_790458 [Serendipita vermifera]|nr:hypothetical protein CPB86DRAFT_790458 [Serendipita vermifera]
MASFYLCDTVESLQTAIKALSAAPIVYLDCEGDDLGQSENGLAIISLGVFEPQPDDPEWSLSIFLVDILAFKDDKAEHIIPIFDMLQSDTVVKVVFDGRMDACKLLHGHNITLRRTVDLQIVDVTSRERRGEDIEKRLGRLKGTLPSREIEENGYLYRSVHRLNGLAPALMEHGIDVGPKIRLDHSKWMQRPLDVDYQHYAALDIRMISLLHKIFSELDLIGAEIEEQSARYLKLHTKGRPSPDDIYNCHGFLPLGVLKEVQPNADLATCTGCQRSLSPDCFPIKDKRKHVQSTACFVCRAAKIYHTFSKNWKKKK